MKADLQKVCLPVFAALIILTLSACSAEQITYIDEDNSYDDSTIDSIVEDVGHSPMTDTPAEESVDLRHKSLVELRSKEGSAEELANLLTSTFSSEIEAVPYYAEAGTFEGTDVWIMLEAWGSSGGTLDRTRMWVFDRQSGDVVMSTTFN